MDIPSTKKQILVNCLDRVSDESSGTRTSSKEPSVYIVTWSWTATAWRKSFTPWGSSAVSARVRETPISWLHSMRLEQYLVGEEILFCCARVIRSVTTAEEESPR